MKKEIIENLEDWAITFHQEDNKDLENEEIEGTYKVYSLAEKLEKGTYDNNDLDEIIFHITNQLGQEGDDLEENKVHEKIKYLEGLKTNNFEVKISESEAVMFFTKEWAMNQKIKTLRICLEVIREELREKIEREEIKNKNDWRGER